MLKSQKWTHSIVDHSTCFEVVFFLKSYSDWLLNMNYKLTLEKSCSPFKQQCKQLSLSLLLIHNISHIAYVLHVNVNYSCLIHSIASICPQEEMVNKTASSLMLWFCTFSVSLNHKSKLKVDKSKLKVDAFFLDGITSLVHKDESQQNKYVQPMMTAVPLQFPLFHHGAGNHTMFEVLPYSSKMEIRENHFLKVGLCTQEGHIHVNIKGWLGVLTEQHHPRLLSSLQEEEEASSKAFIIPPFFVMYTSILYWHYIDAWIFCFVGYYF
jgi:hypothetical protein